MRATALPLILGLSLACQSTPPAPRYIVTTTPIDVVGVGHPGLCVAVDPTDAQGVWWWEPGRSGCSSRSTGPTVFRAGGANVAAPTPSGEIEVHFQLQLMEGAPRDVGLLLLDGGLRVVGSATRVATERRSNLDVPSGV
jgi:hypothetical protein